MSLAVRIIFCIFVFNPAVVVGGQEDGAVVIGSQEIVNVLVFIPAVVIGSQ